MTRILAAIALVLALALAAAEQAQAANIGAAGDISNPPGGLRNDEATAALLGSNGVGLVLPLGDTQYPCALLSDYQAAYDLTWGRYLATTMAATGNHEFLPCATAAAAKTEAGEEAAVPDQAAAADFYRYFGDHACPPPGWCSFRFQGWDFYVLTTTFGALTTTQRTAQLAWFKAALKASTSKCQVVYGHHPYKATASPFTGTPELKDYWPTMVLEGVDLYLSGHNHSYERGKPMRTAGNVDYTFGPGSGGDGHMGVRWVVAGTGGSSLIPFTGTPPASSATRIGGRYGIFKIVPYPTAFLTAFKGADGGTSDRVSWGCH